MSRINITCGIASLCIFLTGCVHYFGPYRKFNDGEWPRFSRAGMPREAVLKRATFNNYRDTPYLSASKPIFPLEWKDFKEDSVPLAIIAAQFENTEKSIVHRCDVYVTSEHERYPKSDLVGLNYFFDYFFYDSSDRLIGYRRIHTDEKKIVSIWGYWWRE